MNPILFMPFLQTEGGPDMTFFLMMIGMMVVFYFFFIRPQMRKQKQEKKFQEEIGKGSRVVMNSGIHGKILEVHDNTIIVETGAGKLTFEKSAISRELSDLRYGPKKEEKTK